MVNQDYRFSNWVSVQAYKHDGALHRQWSPAYLIEENDDCWILGSRSSSVTESDGRKWKTKERAIFVLFKKKWINVIAMFKEGQGICYYANIASPTILDKGYLKYIDYDLDVKLYPNQTEKILDEREYQSHVQTYAYPPDLRFAIEQGVKEVHRMIQNREFPFSDATIKSLYGRFLNENKPMEPNNGNYF